MEHLPFRKRNEFPWMKVIYGALAAAAIAGVSTYVVRRRQNDMPLLPWKSQGHGLEHITPGHRGRQIAGGSSRTEKEILEDSKNPIYPL